MINWFAWQEIDEDVGYRVLASVLDVDDSEAMRRHFLVDGYIARLPFYRRWSLVHLAARPNDQPSMSENIFALWNGERARLLTGDNDALYDANEDEHLELHEAEALEYLRFFLFVVRGDEGAFCPFEKAPDDIPPEAKEPASHARPVIPEGPDANGNFGFKVTLIYGTAMFEASMAVHPGGLVEMLDDEPVWADLPSELLPNIQGFTDASWLRANLPDSALPPPVTPSAERRRIGGARRRPRATRAPATPPAKPAIVVLVELLLEQALIRQSKNRLLDHFNKQAPITDALDRFTALVMNASPVVIVESTIPYVEQVIARIVDERTDLPFGMYQGDLQSDDIGLTFNLPANGPGVALMPLGIHGKVQNLDRLLFDMASRGIGAIVACDRFDQLPESVRRAKDVVLRLPPLDTNLFATFFARVVGAPPPGAWQRGSTDWVRHVQHTDLEHVRRMKLSATAALDFVRGQASDRLASVDARGARGLKQLHGLGEARQWAEDLIADIHAAASGKLSWAQVDSGALLVGAPGTGKTSLANAIARDCGVRFVRGSATQWMAEGVHLGPHIQAIRRTFREARDYAPSILFIDEIDGLGSREMFGGDNNSVYQTEVINAVLEQMQGIDPSAPVVVIGATNHEERVDPALRRSGRLDRVIQIPRPTAQALADIFSDYLKALGPDIKVERDIDVKLLGGISVGLTGADVERTVRGAGRRARKEGRAVSESDLINEITGKPRRTSDTLRLTPADLERTAIHEAGHALASYIGPTKGTEIAFSTVIPRDDGTLGFVAHLPDNRSLLTRRDFDDILEVWLAGRAAEEIRYGADGVSSGASSDLAAASGMVREMVTRSGVTGSGKLLVSDALSDADRSSAEAILDHAYERILRKLRDHEEKLNELAAELAARQELSGQEVRAILKRGRSRAAA